MREQKISVTLTSWIVGAALVLTALTLWKLRSLFVLLMVAIVLAATVSPIVAAAERLRLPRWIAVLLIYVGVIAGLVGITLLVGPTVISQIEQLARQVPIAIETIVIWLRETAITLSYSRPELFANLFNIGEGNQSEAIAKFLDLRSIVDWVVKPSQQLLVSSISITRNIVGGLLSVILALFISGYMVSDSETLIERFTRLFPQPWDQRLAAQVPPISRRMGTYIRGRFVVSLILALATTIGLSFLGLSQFALGLGTIAGLTNLIPFIGPVLGAIPALIVAVTQGGWTVLWVLAFYVVLQNIETYVLDPLLVGSVVGIHPLYQLLSVLAGVQIFGILGALITPPWFAGIAVVVDNLYLQPKLAAERAKDELITPTEPLKV